MKKNILLVTVLAFVLVACGGGGQTGRIYESEGEAAGDETTKIRFVDVVENQPDRLVVEFGYTYRDEVPADEIKLFVLPDHGYWQMQDVSIESGSHEATATIGLSESNMEDDGVSESETSLLRFRFEHYRPGEYVGRVGGEDIPFEKHWSLP
ncbi:hypothetical protein [Wenzhouxiangella sediminis]|uniref:Lipoprotein n=1 Tax=Wenzhouxiangella sediminis TaxID=1792836 RepID=A0A3E1K9N1_9GAMM|nr:hypothetical protein [Wenzhouxiangella sediminis]RFF30868.1 hypothetical protein DZC52_06390 [Wenzhouxiangella sediminis]